MEAAALMGKDEDKVVMTLVQWADGKIVRDQEASRMI